jgi:PAS domain S-box-containing protein
MLERFIKDNLILETLIDSVYDCICIVDTKCRVLLWNAASEKLYGFTKEQILYKDLRLFFPNALLPEVLATHKSYVNHLHVLEENRRIVINAKPLYLEGKLVGAIGADRDVSEIADLSERLTLATRNLDKLKEEIDHLYDNRFSFDELIGVSQKMHEAVEMAKSVSRSTLSVLLTGESGTGKELFARAVHKRSGRKGLFVPINCTAIPRSLLESELFGYVEGAFTGASRGGKAGLFEVAHEGTLFLDEIGDMPMGMQAKLLRVLEDGNVQRLGSHEWFQTDVRIIAATNHSLRERIDEKAFRSDLFYRLNAVHIHLPPLRDRRDDIELLVYEFTRHYCQRSGRDMIDYPPEVVKKLKQYNWEGNVRELKNMVERFVIMCSSRQKDIVDVSMLPEELKGKALAPVEQVGLIQAVEAFEKHVIEKMLKDCRGNRAKCAKKLAIPRSTLYFKLDKYGIMTKDADVSEY